MHLNPRDLLNDARVTNMREVDCDLFVVED